MAIELTLSFRMNFLHPLCYSRIVICLLVIFSIKFGNYTCVDLTKSVTETFVKSCVVSNETGLVVYKPPTEECGEFFVNVFRRFLVIVF